MLAFLITQIGQLIVSKGYLLECPTKMLAYLYFALCAAKKTIMEVLQKKYQESIIYLAD